MRSKLRLNSGSALKSSLGAIWFSKKASLLSRNNLVKREKHPIDASRETAETEENTGETSIATIVTAGETPLALAIVIENVGIDVEETHEIGTIATDRIVTADVVVGVEKEAAAIETMKSATTATGKSVVCTTDGLAPESTTALDSIINYQYS